MRDSCQCLPLDCRHADRRGLRTHLRSASHRRVRCFRLPERQCSGRHVTVVSISVGRMSKKCDKWPSPIGDRRSIKPSVWGIRNGMKLVRRAEQVGTIQAVESTASPMAMLTATARPEWVLAWPSTTAMAKAAHVWRLNVDAARKVDTLVDPVVQHERTVACTGHSRL